MATPRGARVSPRSLPPLEVRNAPRAPGHDLYHFALTRSWLEYVALAAGVFLLVNLSFAGVYLAFPGAIQNARPGSLADAFFFSVHTMTTIGYGTMAPDTAVGHVLVAVEAFTGLLFTAGMTGLGFAKLSRPTARVLFSASAVIAPRDGVPHLCFRMANARHNQVVEAQLRVLVLVLERTREGVDLRVPIEVPLVRDRSAMFSLTWTAMHRIDEKSPFFGPDWRERLAAVEAEIYLSLTATDDTTGQGLHARYRYGLGDVVEGARFADVLSTLPDGTRVIDYAHFDEVLPLASPHRESGA
jgi:inward rectifier potassium channel